MYELFLFRSKGQLIVTRGLDATEAATGMRKMGVSSFESADFGSETISYNEAAYQYSISHPFDWVNNPPRWKSPNHPFAPVDTEFKNQFSNGKTEK